MSEGHQRPGPNPLLERRLSHVCLPVIDTQIMLVDSIKVRLSLSQQAAAESLPPSCPRLESDCK